jgi:hypothetical protein
MRHDVAVVDGGAYGESDPAALVTFDLSARQNCLLGANLDALAEARGPISDRDRVRALAPIARTLDAAQDLLAAERPAIVRLRNLPVDEIDRSGPLPHATPRADVFLHSFICAQGRQPMAYAEARSGRIFQDVFPLPDALDKPHAHGAAKIRWHIDGGGYPRDLIPDRMGLLGLANETEVTTDLASTDAVLNALSPRSARLLEQPLFRYCLPNATGGVDKNRFTPWLPLVTRRAGSPIFAYMFPYVLAKANSGAAQAIAELERAANECATRLLIERGDLVFWANGPFMHSRGAVAHGGLRWLKRAFALELNTYNRSFLGSDHLVKVTTETVERLACRYRP